MRTGGSVCKEPGGKGFAQQHGDGTQNADQGNIVFNCQEIRNEFSQKYVSQDKTPFQPK